MNLTKHVMLSAALSCLAAFSVRANVLGDGVLDADCEVFVAEGATKRIEYLSGTASATLVKKGGGTLEIAIFGNSNARILVEEGMLRSVRPSALSLSEPEKVYFHADAAAADTLTLVPADGTNFISCVGNVRSGTGLTAAPVASRPKPFLKAGALNGLDVFDFGSFHCGKQTGSGAALNVSTAATFNEVLYVWQDYEGVKDIDLAGGDPIVGPNPVNLRYSYRGKGGDGVGYSMYHTAHGQVTANLVVDGVSATSAFVPSEGDWHLVSIHSTTPITSKLSDYGFYGFGTSPGAQYQYGGFRLAEAIVCSEALTEADRRKATAYLDQKWFGGKPFAFLGVGAGAALDTSAAPLKVTVFHMDDEAAVTGGGLQYSGTFGSNAAIRRTSAVTVADKRTSLTPNYAFSGDAVMDVPSGTGLVDRVSSSTGRFRKTGAGTLELALPSTSLTRLEVAAGELLVDPLKTPGAYLHVDATRADTMTCSDLNGTNLVTQWRDVTFGDRYLKQSGEKHAYGSKGVKQYPFLTDAFTNGLPVVDFGTFSSSAHQDGWGAEMDVYPRINSPVASDNPALTTVLAVWGDREEVKDLPLVHDSPFPGPCLFGAGGIWYRGAGGGGAGFPSVKGTDSSFGDSVWINGTQIPYMSWQYGYVPPESLYVQNVQSLGGRVTLQQIGGNATQTNANDPNTIRGVAGGLRLGELLLFRYAIPDEDRFRIDHALGVKWFGAEYGDARLEYDLDSVVVAAGASAAFPYADLTATNLAVAGSVTARTVVARNLTVLDGEIAAPLSLADGGTISVTDASGEIPCLTAQSVSFEGTGTIVLSAPSVGESVAEPLKVIAVAGGPEVPQRVRGWRTETGVRAVLVRRADGYYLDPAPGAVLIVR